MATTEVAPSKDDDPVLDNALSEMSSDGAFDEPGDLSPDEASQATADESAEGPAAPAEAPGDDGSGKAVEAQAEVEGDPLEGTEPFAYTVNGESKPLDWAYRVPGEGVIIPDDKVPQLEQLAERADSLDRIAREADQRVADYDRLAEWRTTGPDGKEQVYQGREAVVEMKVGFQKLAAVVQTLDRLFDDPQRFQELVGVNEQGQIVPARRAIQHLQTEIRLAQATAEQDTRKQIGTLSTVPQSAGPDLATEAPRIINMAAGQDAKALTKDDLAYLSAQLDRYIRPTTDEDRRAFPGYRGKEIVDAKFTALVKHTAGLRSESAKQAAAAERAGKFNAGQARGRQPVAQPTKPTPPARPADTQKPGKADWDTPLKEALAEMDIPSR